MGPPMWLSLCMLGSKMALRYRKHQFVQFAQSDQSLGVDGGIDLAHTILCEGYLNTFKGTAKNCNPDVNSLIGYRFSITKNGVLSIGARIELTNDLTYFIETN